MMNLKPTEVARKYGELSVSQFNCLTCRSAMYTWCIAKARRGKYKFIAEGAREDQKFAIEQRPMIKEFDNLVKSYGLSLLLPVYDQSDDRDLKDRMLARHFVPKVLEPQCLLGIAVCKPKLDADEIGAARAYFRSEILKKAKSLIERPGEINLEPFRGWR